MKRTEQLIATAVVGLILVIGFAVNGILMVRASVPQDVREFRVALVRLDAAIHQGLSNAKYSDLALDARTNIELARPKLTDMGRANVCDEAVTAIEQGQAIWQATLEKKIPESAFEPMHALGIIERKRFDAIRNGDNEAADMSSSSAMWEEMQESRAEFRRKAISAALTAVSIRIEKALRAIDGNKEDKPTD